MQLNLAPEERAWLAHQAQIDHVPQTEVVRRALHLYRLKTATPDTQSFEELARMTSGMLQREDGLLIQQKLREEWSER